MFSSYVKLIEQYQREVFFDLLGEATKYLVHCISYSNV